MKITILSACLLAFLFTFSTQTFAATFTVTNLADSGAGSLRQTIIDANTLAGDDVIIFHSGVAGTILLTSGELLIDSNITINGSGADVISISGNSQSRVFNIVATSTANINNLTITKGSAPSAGNGSGLLNAGNLIVSNLKIVNNTAATSMSPNYVGSGVGISNSGTMTLHNSTVSGNYATGGLTHFSFGGGILNTGTLDVINSTVSNNAAKYGGGIFNTGILTVTNSTVYGNYTRGTHGRVAGIYQAGGSLTLRNSTVAYNSSGAQGSMTGVGILVSSSTATLSNTIVANNIGRDALTLSPILADVEGVVVSQGNNLISNTTGSSGWISSDLLNQSARLAPLTDNGGFTQTAALLPDSPAIDAGNNALAVNPITSPRLEFDQRGVGFWRIRDGNSNGMAIVDIGAFEVQACGLIDTDLDGIMDGCDSDDDNDGVADEQDAFPLDGNESVDTDGDGTGNTADTDDDNDGQSDAAEIACGSNPLDAASKCAPSTTGAPTNIEQCKNGGWKTFTVPRRFKNQGDCIQFVNTGK